jgi:hypothetical protein
MAQSRTAENEDKRRWWKEHIDAWAASGKTQAAYCRQQDLSYYRFQYWKKRLHQSSKPAFIELCLGPAKRQASPAPLRLMVGGCQVAVERNFDPVALQQLIGVLSRL